MALLKSTSCMIISYTRNHFILGILAQALPFICRWSSRSAPWHVKCCPVDLLSYDIFGAVLVCEVHVRQCPWSTWSRVRYLLEMWHPALVLHACTVHCCLNRKPVGSMELMSPAYTPLLLSTSGFVSSKDPRSQPDLEAVCKAGSLSLVALLYYSRCALYSHTVFLQGSELS